MAQNIVANAIAHTDAGAPVDVTVYRSGGDVRVEVADRGEGIAQEEIDKVFERYYRADKKGPSTGLGLAIAKNVVEAHGGSVAVESVLGAGTTFTVTLPLHR